MRIHARKMNPLKDHYQFITIEHCALLNEPALVA